MDTFIDGILLWEIKYHNQELERKVGTLFYI